MTDKLLSRQDIDFYLHDWLGVQGVVDRETIDAFIDLSQELAEDLFLPHYKTSDRVEPSLDAEGVHILPEISQALARYAELGLFSAGFEEKHGGLGLPYLACSASFAYFAAANVATAAYPMLTTANARLIATFGAPAQIEHFVAREIAGEWFGTMCLSEPQAGSSLADIRTRAEPDGDDRLGPRYRLTGDKMWISGGDQDATENIVHLVLAKVPDANGVLPESTQGLSLFIVPKILPDGGRNDVRVVGLNHKMGYRGTANCLMRFGDEGGAVGWIVGAPGQGLRQMFMMMNEARIGVGIGAAALGYRGHRHSVTYAKERVQGRAAGARGGPPVPIIAHVDVRRMLLQQKAYVEGAMALCLYCAKLVDNGVADEDSATLLGLLTPVAKTWPSEYGLAANDIAIQIHGGYGYTRDFDLEQLWRDNRLNAIHEGTTGIQAVDLLGRKILRDGAALPLLQAAIGRTAERARDTSALAPHAEALEQAWSDIRTAADDLQAAEAGALDNATAFLWAFGHVVVAWLWLDVALTADGLDEAGEARAAFVEGKRRACRFFYESELPKVKAWLHAVSLRSDVAADASAAIF